MTPLIVSLVLAGTPDESGRFGTMARQPVLPSEARLTADALSPCAAFAKPAAWAFGIYRLGGSWGGTAWAGCRGHLVGFADGGRSALVLVLSDAGRLGKDVGNDIVTLWSVGTNDGKVRLVVGSGFPGRLGSRGRRPIGEVRDVGMCNPLTAGGRSRCPTADRPSSVDRAFFSRPLGVPAAGYTKFAFSPWERYLLITDPAQVHSGMAPLALRSIPGFWLFDAASGRPLLTRQAGSLYQVVFSPSGCLLAIGRRPQPSSPFNRLEVIEAASMRPVLNFREGCHNFCLVGDRCLVTVPGDGVKPADLAGR